MIYREIKFNRRRRFGAELEFNSPDNQTMARTFQRLGQPVRVCSYTHTGAVDTWHCKTDGSCGYEVSSKVLSGPRDIKLLGEVLSALVNDGAVFDNRCGQHIHVETSDFTSAQKQILGMYWIKVENFVMNAEKQHRRNNNYCTLANQLVGHLVPNQTYAPSAVYDSICRNRGAINFGGSETTEFRFGSMTNNPDELKNRVRFLIWFVDICKNMPAPPNLNWFTPKQTLRFMGLWNDPKTDVIKKSFSPAIISMRKWILNQFIANAPTVHYGRDIRLVNEMIQEISCEESQRSENLELIENFDE